MESNTFLCYYCHEQFNIFCEIIYHLCNNHNNFEIKYKERELCPSSGKLGYRTKIFQDIIPENYTIAVTDDNRLSISNVDRTKRKKANTPIRSNFTNITMKCSMQEKNLYQKC